MRVRRPRENFLSSVRSGMFQRMTSFPRCRSRRLHIFNPKGIVSSSPGLRGTSYPGRVRAKVFNPEGVVAPGTHTLRPRKSQRRNHFRVESVGQPRTQGSSFLATLGFGAESLWDSSAEAVSKHPCKVQGDELLIQEVSRQALPDYLTFTFPPRQTRPREARSRFLTRREAPATKAAPPCHSRRLSLRSLRRSPPPCPRGE